MTSFLPRKRTISTMIMVRNTLFQNLATKLQIRSWKILCHLRNETAIIDRKSSVHMLAQNITLGFFVGFFLQNYHSSAVLFVQQHTWLWAPVTYLLAEMKGKQRMTMMPISTYRKRATAVHCNVIVSEDKWMQTDLNIKEETGQRGWDAPPINNVSLEHITN